MDEQAFNCSGETIGLRPKMEHITNNSIEIDEKRFGNFNFLHSQTPSTSQLGSLFPTPAPTPFG